MKVSETIVYRKVNALKPDPNQPRKSFDEKVINDMADSMQKGGVIVPLDIDNNDIIVMGEYRWRSAKKAGLINVPCRVITEITPMERLERQLVENIHQHPLKDIELEDAIKRLWISNEYKSKEELAKRIGYKSSSTVIQSLAAQEIRRSEPTLTKSVSTQTAYSISTLPKTDQKKVLDKMSKGEIKTSEVGKVVSTIKKLPKDVKMKILASNKPIDKKTLETAKKTAALPPEVKKEIMKPKSTITVEQATQIANLPKETQRKEAVKTIKEEKKKQPIVVKEIKEDPQLQLHVIKIYNDIYDRVVINCTKKMIHTYNEPTRKQVMEIVKRTITFLNDQFQ